MSMIANDLEPFHATHPGEILRDELEYRELTQRELSERTGIAYSQLKDIVDCKRDISMEAAMLIGAALDINPETLLNMQLRYNVHTVRRNPSFMERLSSIRRTH